MATLTYANDYIQMPADGAGKRSGYFRFDTGSANYLYIPATVLTTSAGVEMPAGGGVESAALRVTLANDSTGVLTVKQATGTNLHVVVDTAPSTAVTNAGTFAVQADTELTTADLDTGAGADTRAVVGLALGASGGATLMTNAPTAHTAGDGIGLLGAGMLAYDSGTSVWRRFPLRNGFVDTAVGAGAGGADGYSNVLLPSTRDGTNYPLATALWGYNGASYDRVRTANTGRLQVDVITAPSTAVTNAGTFAVQAVAAGDVAAGAADSGNPVKIAGKFNSSPPVLSNGARGDVQLDSNGNMRMTIMGGSVNASVLNATADGQTNTSIPVLLVGGRTQVYNGSTWDMARGAPSADGAARTGLAAAALMGFNGLTWDRLTSDTANGLDVDVTRVSGTVTVGSPGLPTALGQAAMAASMPVTIASDQTSLLVVGSVASNAADSGAPVKVGAVYNSTAPTFDSGDRADLQADVSGRLKVALPFATVNGEERVLVYDPRARSVLNDILYTLKELLKLQTHALGGHD